MKLTIQQQTNILRGRERLQYAAEYAEWTWYRSGGSEVGTWYSDRWPELSFNSIK